VDEEHLDFYANLEAVCREFANFGRQPGKTLIFCADDARLTELFARQPGGNSYGFHPRAAYRLVSKVPRARSEAAAAGAYPTSRSHRLRSLAMARQTRRLQLAPHRRQECLQCRRGRRPVASARLCPGSRSLGHRGTSAAPSAVSRTFRDQRFGVFDDYAHSPAEIDATSQAFQGLGARRLLVAFQPIVTPHVALALGVRDLLPRPATGFGSRNLSRQ